MGTSSMPLARRSLLRPIGADAPKAKPWRHLAFLTAMVATLGVSAMAMPGAAHAGTPNTKPVAMDDSYSFKQLNNLSVDAPGLLANDSDADHDSLSVKLLTGPNSGVLNGFYSNGAFTYVPYSHTPGYDWFTYEVWDGTQYSTPATVYIHILPTNTPPVGQPDNYTVIENGTLSVGAPGLLANDGDPDGDGVTVAYVQTGPKYGVLSETNVIGHFVYKPQPGFVGIDTFKYVITDGKLGSVAVPVTIHVMPLKAVPHNDAYTIGQDHPLDVASPGLLKNDVDPNGYPMTIGDITKQPTHGHVLWYFLTGGFHYVPNAGFYGTDTFTYNVVSDNQKSSSATVIITIKPDQKPIAHNDSFNVGKNGKLTVAAPGVLKNDTDAEKDKLTVAAYLSNPAHGTLTQKRADGTFVYTPKKGFVGKDQFTYRVSDGHINGFASATVSLSVK